MNVTFENGMAIMPIQDFMDHFNYEGKTETAVVTRTEEQKDVYDITTDLIVRKGLKPHLLGFKYIRKAIELCVQDPKCLDYVTKTLYPGVAKEFGTTANRVERAIRHSIEIIHPHNKPTNSEFIAQLVEEVSAALKIQSRKVG